jgi:hypothetical protein
MTVDSHCRQGAKHIGLHFLLVTAGTENYKTTLPGKSFLFDSHHAILVPDFRSCSRALEFRCIAYTCFHHVNFNVIMVYFSALGAPSACSGY